MVHGAIVHALIRCSHATPFQHLIWRRILYPLLRGSANSLVLSYEIRWSVNELLRWSARSSYSFVQVWRYQGINFIVPHLGIRFHCNIYTTTNNCKNFWVIRFFRALLRNTGLLVFPRVSETCPLFTPIKICPNYTIGNKKSHFIIVKFIKIWLIFRFCVYQIVYVQSFVLFMTMVSIYSLCSSQLLYFQKLNKQ